MRRTRLLLSVMLAVILTVGLCSCGSKDSDTKEKTGAAADEKAAEEGAEVKEEAPAEPAPAPEPVPVEPEPQPVPVPEPA